MRIVVVADVHANLEALQAVLADASAGGAIDALWSLGDMVGYGPDPRQCLELLRSHPLKAIAGNHDLAASGAVTLDDFNPFAAEAARWTSPNWGESCGTVTLPSSEIADDFLV